MWNLGPTNDFPFPRSGEFRRSDKGGGGGGVGGSGRHQTLSKGGPGLPKKFLGALRAPQAPPLDPPLPSNSKIYEKGLRSNQEPIIYPDITKPRYSEPNFVSPLAFVISQFHCISGPQFEADLSWWSPNSVVTDSMAPGRNGRYTPPHPEIRGGGGRPQKNFFSVLRASFWSKNERGRAPPAPPLDRHWHPATAFKLHFCSYKLGF